MVSRREWLGMAALAGAGVAAVAAEGAAQERPRVPAVEGESAPAGASLPAGAKLPAFEFVYECEVTIRPPEDFGDTIEGHRRVIPITGGTFQGPEMRGTVVPGGADWNLTRRDGGSSVEADYYIRTDDGVTIRIHNQGVAGGNHAPQVPDASETFFMYTIPRFEAPAGSRYEWLNRAVFVGTLQGRKGLKDAVLIRVFRLA